MRETTQKKLCTFLQSAGGFLVAGGTIASVDATRKNNLAQFAIGGGSLLLGSCMQLVGDVIEDRITGISKDGGYDLTDKKTMISWGASGLKLLRNASIGMALGFFAHDNLTSSTVVLSGTAAAAAEIAKRVISK